MAATSQTVSTRLAQDSDFSAWETLWKGYLAFYEASVSPDITAKTWARCLDPEVPMACLLATATDEQGGERVIGFAIVVLQLGTWSDAPLAYLEDLFVSADARRLGAGRALIQDLIEEGRAQGWSKIYWQTDEKNATARALYDQIAEKKSWVRYELDLSDA